MMQPGRYDWVCLSVKGLLSDSSETTAFAIHDKESNIITPVDIGSIKTYRQLMDHNHSIIEQCYELNRVDRDDDLYIKEIEAYTNRRVVSKTYEWMKIPPF